VRRYRIIISAVFLATLGAILPILVMLYVSWTLAVKAERQRLELFADRAITRAEQSYDSVLDALRTIDRSDLVPCSPAHIGLMRKLAIDNTAVEEMGYFHDHRLACTSWGPVEQDVPQRDADLVTADGVAVTFSVRPLVSEQHPLMALHLHQHNALVDPVRFVDLIVDPQIRLAIASRDGHLIGSLNQPDPTLLRRILADPRGGMDSAAVYAVARGGDWLAIAIEPRAEMLGNLQREQALLLPIALFIAGLIVTIVVWASRRRLSPQAELAIAIQRDEFLVHYQPVIELGSNICAGAEALVRWRRPDGTLVRPDLFIPLAEDAGLITQITERVLAHVVRDLGPAMLDDRSLHVAINLSADDLHSGTLPALVQRSLSGSGIHPEQVWFEATERGFMDMEPAVRTITALRAAGHSMAIDDFGTGYSSLQYLQTLPLDALKIDKSFIDTIGLDSATSSVTDHIIGMCRSLRLYAVAEGVERPDQVDYLRAAGVEFAQGWLFSRPLPAQEFLAFHARSRSLHGAAPDVIQRPR
jgi:sensor c-di-GMP phosphodiesterase-like protein